MPLSSAGPRGDGVDGPGTYGSGSACPATPADTASPAAPPIAATTVSAATVSATTGGCPTIGAPHPEHTRAVTATSAAHSRHLICTHPAADAHIGGLEIGLGFEGFGVATALDVDLLLRPRCGRSPRQPAG